jgi:uncharacterized SAM-binding protein YcdF (DUF218 family)
VPGKRFAKYRLLFFLLLSLNVIAISLVFTPVANYLYAVLEVKPEIRKADSIILLSSGVYTDKIFMRDNYQRIMHAYWLYKQGYADKIIICGGAVVKGLPSLAELMKDFLVEIGMDGGRIITENHSRNTYENISNIKPVLSELDINSSLLVTSSYHMYRSLAISKKLGIVAYPAPVICYEKNVYRASLRTRFITEILREYGAILYFWLKGWI